jgi:polar amino acid transport system substrate-binding protein
MLVETTEIAVEHGHVGYGDAQATGTPRREAFIAAMDHAIRSLRAAGGLPALDPAPGSAQGTRFVLLVDADNAPYTHADGQGGALGSYVDALRALLAGLPFTVEVRPAPWTRALRDVETGRADGVFAVYRKPQMRPWMRYSEPLFTQTTVVLCRRDIDPRLREAPWPQGFAGLRIGNIDGFVPVDRALFDMAAAGQVLIEETRSLENTLRKLVAGRIDCYPGERGAVAATVRAAGLDPAGIVEMQAIAEEAVHVGYGSEAQTWSPERERLIRALDDAIRAARGAGRLPPVPSP